MPARIAVLGDAVVSTINAARATLSNPGGILDCPVAERVAASRYDTVEHDAFKVDVVFGDARTIGRATRGSSVDRPTIDVQIYHKVLSDGGTLTSTAMKVEADRIAALGEGIADALLLPERLGGYRLGEVTFEGVIIDEWVRNYGVVGSVMSLTFER